MNTQLPEFSVSDFVAVFNQSIVYAFPLVTITGELANLRVSKNRWVYFDLKDDEASVKFFGTVYQLPGPLEDGMVLSVTGTPQLHARFGFSVNVQNIQLAGEGTIKKAAKLLEAKLQKEGLFGAKRKRPLPYPPKRIGLITSGESAAYADFCKILKARWTDLEILLHDVQVQGQDAPTQIVGALEYFNAHASEVDVIVITRGGGSADDLQAFSTELVTRAVAGSRTPTLVAIGHEVDISLAEMAADQRASTPSNAAELLTPDKKQQLELLDSSARNLKSAIIDRINSAKRELTLAAERMTLQITQNISSHQNKLAEQKRLLELLSPEAALKRGYALVKLGAKFVNKQTVKVGDEVTIILQAQELRATIKSAKER